MVRLIFSILILLHFQTGMACMSAHQDRLFPVGICAEGLVVVEVHMQRYDKPDKEDRLDPAWHILSYLNLYDKNHKILKSEILDTINVLESLYNKPLANTFLKGLQKAKQIPGLVLAMPVSINFCDYRQDCSSASLEFDTIKNKVFIRPGNQKKKVEVSVLRDTISIAANYLGYSAQYELQVKELKNFLYISSVRIFKVGEKTLTIFHLGSGQGMYSADDEMRQVYPPGKEYKPDFQFTNLEASIFEEPLLHHGHGFDFFILQ
ncbi:MAG: hypothetical protein ACJ75J_07215 [Cytophagaceae bacterium]